uniref:H(+)-exporting diphosphatase n=1 Tax=Macrostomum lignano TaxID=282301 RepID=A0A1I8FV53_9PLAT
VPFLFKYAVDAVNDANTAIGSAVGDGAPVVAAALFSVTGLIASLDLQFHLNRQTGALSRAIDRGTSRAVCGGPCAYLERGGFWDSPTAVSLGVSDRVYRERRCSCQHETSETVKFSCSSALRFSGPGAPFCPTSGGGAFALRQTGWWIDLHEAPGAAARPRPGRPAFGDFATPSRAAGDGREGCATRLWTPLRRGPGLLRESLNKQGRRTGGQVLCTCPPDTYCPVYTGQGARTVPADPTPETSSNSTAEVAEELSDTGQRIELLCVTAGP